MIAEKHQFDRLDIDVSNEAMLEFAARYLKIRGHVRDGFDSIEDDPKFKNLGFSTEEIKKIIKENTIPLRKSTAPVSDIYRSDLGEMLLTLFFDEEFEDFGHTYIIPLKNIWDREHNEMPGRGIDVTGYKEEEDKIKILIGEAKVSEEKATPPQASIEIYNEQIKYTATDKIYLKRRLSNYSKKLSPEYAKNFAVVLCAIENGMDDIYEIIYGCCLVRDTGCYNDKDYGKMLSKKTEFDSGSIHFIIPIFSKPIAETVNLFYQKVQELGNA